MRVEPSPNRAVIAGQILMPVSDFPNELHFCPVGTRGRIVIGEPGAQRFRGHKLLARVLLGPVVKGVIHGCLVHRRLVPQPALGAGADSGVVVIRSSVERQNGNRGDSGRYTDGSVDRDRLAVRDEPGNLEEDLRHRPERT